jgi:hypothetical protein
VGSVFSASHKTQDALWVGSVSFIFIPVRKPWTNEQTDKTERGTLGGGQWFEQSHQGCFGLGKGGNPSQYQLQDTQPQKYGVSQFRQVFGFN